MRESKRTGNHSNSRPNNTHAHAVHARAPPPPTHTLALLKHSLNTISCAVALWHAVYTFDGFSPEISPVAVDMSTSFTSPCIGTTVKAVAWVTLPTIKTWFPSLFQSPLSFDPTSRMMASPAVKPWAVVVVTTGIFEVVTDAMVASW